MKLILKHPIPLLFKHPDTPEWLFITNNAISPQTISLDEEHMKELLIFINSYAVHFNEEELGISVEVFSDIIMTYNPTGKE